MRTSKTTPMQRIDVIAWHKLKISLGTAKTKANELGISESAVRHIVSVYVRRERREADRQIKVARAMQRIKEAHSS